MLSKKGVFLKGLVESKGVPETCDIIQQLIESGEVTVADFSIKQLAEATMGEDWVHRLNPGAAGGGVVLLEADSAGVGSSAFANISGQLFYNATLAGYNAPGMIADQLVTTMPSGILGDEKIGGVTEPLGESDEVGEGMDYPEVGMGEDWINTGAGVKRGNILPITREAIFADRTGMLIQQAGRIGERVRLKKENAVLDMVMGVTNPFSWKGTAYNTYLTSGGWVNDAASKELLDYSSLEEVSVALADITNPFQTDSSEPVPYILKDLLVMPYKQWTAKRINTATEVRTVSNTNNTTIGASPAPTMNVLVSALAKQRLVLSGVSSANANQYWLAGDFKAAFGYKENWPLRMEQQIDSSEQAFNRDVVLRLKASERGTPFIQQPRAVQRRRVT